MHVKSTECSFYSNEPNNRLWWLTHMNIFFSAPNSHTWQHSMYFMFVESKSNGIALWRENFNLFKHFIYTSNFQNIFEMCWSSGWINLHNSKWMNTNIFGTLANWMMRFFSFCYFYWHQNSGMFDITITPHHWHVFISLIWKIFTPCPHSTCSYHIKTMFVEIHMCEPLYVYVKGGLLE